METPEIYFSKAMILNLVVGGKLFVGALWFF
jgi:hypothetical protein